MNRALVKVDVCSFMMVSSAHLLPSIAAVCWAKPHAVGSAPCHLPRKRRDRVVGRAGPDECRRPGFCLQGLLRLTSGSTKSDAFKERQSHLCICIDPNGAF